MDTMNHQPGFRDIHVNIPAFSDNFLLMRVYEWVPLHCNYVVAFIAKFDNHTLLNKLLLENTKKSRLFVSYLKHKKPSMFIKYNAHKCIKLLSGRHLCMISSMSMVTAARYGHINIMKYLLSSNLGNININTCKASIQSGSLECVKFAWKNRAHVYVNGIDTHSTGIPEIINACGHIMKNNMLTWALCAGKLDVLQYIHENMNYEFETGACSVSAQVGSIDCLRYVHRQGCDFTHDTFACAVIGGNLDCIDYLYAYDCPMTANAFMFAKRSRNRGILERLNIFGCPTCADN